MQRNIKTQSLKALKNLYYDGKRRYSIIQFADASKKLHVTLERYNHPLTEEEKIGYLLDAIKDDSVIPTLQHIQGDPTLTFDDAILRLTGAVEHFGRKPTESRNVSSAGRGGGRGSGRGGRGGRGRGGRGRGGGRGNKHDNNRDGNYIPPEIWNDLMSRRKTAHDEVNEEIRQRRAGTFQGPEQQPRTIRTIQFIDDGTNNPQQQVQVQQAQQGEEPATRAADSITRRNDGNNGNDNGNRAVRSIRRIPLSRAIASARKPTF